MNIIKKKQSIEQCPKLKNLGRREKSKKKIKKQVF